VRVVPTLRFPAVLSPLEASAPSCASFRIILEYYVLPYVAPGPIGTELRGFTNFACTEFSEVRFPWGCAAHTALYLVTVWKGCTSNFACTEF
jgi:hypothetical protein